MSSVFCAGQFEADMADRINIVLAGLMADGRFFNDESWLRKLSQHCSQIISQLDANFAAQIDRIEHSDCLHDSAAQIDLENCIFAVLAADRPDIPAADILFLDDDRITERVLDLMSAYSQPH